MRSPSRLGRFMAVVVSGLALTGCASLNVSSYVERGTEFARYRTYGWDPAEARSTGDPRLDNNPFFHDRVKAGVERQLADKGLEQATSAMPDLIVHYHASITQRIDVNNLDRDYAYCETEDCLPYVYEAGTLVVDLVDPRTKRVVWRGWAEGAVDGVIDNQEWLERKVDDAVKRILEKLPRWL